MDGPLQEVKKKSMIVFEPMFLNENHFLGHSAPLTVQQSGLLLHIILHYAYAGLNFFAAEIDRFSRNLQSCSKHLFLQND